MLKSTGNDIRRRIRGHYEPLIRPGAEHHEMLDWASKDAQIARFMVLERCLRDTFLAMSGGQITESDPPRLLDVGCGISDLKSFLEWKKIAAHYFGVDITPGILSEARRKHPDRALILADVFQAAPFRKHQFDVVFCSGTLNLRLGNNSAFAAKALAAMMDLAGRLIVVNFLHQRTRERYNQCFYYDPDAILETARAVAPTGTRLRIIDDYLENDFTLEAALDTSLAGSQNT